ncbi:ATP-binding protein [Niveibacterium sp. COAC-50]|uniref:ATP-binding protein n=1 Tax=Niveibacterium sp. COAC-50 TaxID=2729384 RepID=UPI0015562C1D|nr:ATP-binding protein [Niveibacterium sp. COAC-50]
MSTEPRQGLRAIRLPRGIGAVLVAFCLFGLIAVLYHANRLRNEAVLTHRTLASNVARVGEYQVTLMMQMIDRQLDASLVGWREQPGNQADAFEAQLQGAINGLPAIRSLAIVAKDGRILASSAPGVRGRRLDAAAVRAIGGASDATLLRVSGVWIGRDLGDGEPSPGPVDARASAYFFTVARPLVDAHDEGYVVATINPDYFVNQLASAAAREDFLVSVSRYDGLMLLSTAPEQAAPGTDQSADPLFSKLLLDREIGLATGADPAVSRAYHASRLYPLVLQVRFTQDTILHDWRREMGNLAAMSIGALVFVLVFGGLVHRLQVRREREQMAARDALELAASVFDAAFDGIMITDPQCRILRVNRAFTQITGYTEGEVVGRTPHVLSSGLHEADFYRELWQTINREGRWQGELINRRRSGELYPEHLAISAVKDAQGRVCNYIGTFNDVTERHRSEAALRSAKEAAETANRAKSHFLATMSHEIRTPMNGILGMAQLLQMPDLSDAEREEYARTVLSSGETLLTLLNDILDLSRVEAGRMDLNPTACMPAVLLDETSALFADAAQRKGLSIETHWSGDALDTFWLDPVRLRQMLSNLISNAIKFSVRGVIRVEGEVLSRESDTVQLRFAVTDCGIGIAPDKLGMLFQPFSQVDTAATRSAGGSGLGLSIVRSLALLMDGDVGVRSEPGEGACFWFRIQARLHGAAAAASPALRPALQSLPHSHGEDEAPLILVVEDSPTNAKVIETMLLHRHYRVMVAGDGLQAADLLAQGHSPDLILMDCQMPVLDGFAATRRIREWESSLGRERVPIVALTANAFAENRAQCFAAGMDDFLAKPVVLKTLLEVLSRWLPQRETVASDA